MVDSPLKSLIFFLEVSKFFVLLIPSRKETFINSLIHSFKEEPIFISLVAGAGGFNPQNHLSRKAISPFNN